MDLLKSYGQFLVDAFNSEWFWLPSRYTWEDFKPPHTPELEARGCFRPQGVQELWLCLPLAVIFLVIRLALVKYVYPPIGRWLGLKDVHRPKPPPPNAKLDKIFQQNAQRLGTHSDGHPKTLKVDGVEVDLETCAKMAFLPDGKKVLSWLRRKRNSELATPLEKFGTAAFELSVFLPLSLLHYYCVYDQPWFRDTSVMSSDFNTNGVAYKMYWEYVITDALYFCLIASLFTSARRKDHVVMLSHHIIVLILSVLAYHGHWLPMGAMTWFAFDFCDVFLNLAKLSQYSGYKLLNALFSWTFLVIWCLARLVYQPLRIVYPAWQLHMNGWADYLAGIFMIYFLVIILFMQLYWTFFLLKMLYRVHQAGGMTDIKDERSDSEAESCSDDSLAVDRNGNLGTQKN